MDQIVVVPLKIDVYRGKLLCRILDALMHLVHFFEIGTLNLIEKTDCAYVLRV